MRFVLTIDLIQYRVIFITTNPGDYQSVSHLMRWRGGLTDDLKWTIHPE